MPASESQERSAFLKTCLVKDLRTECRNRGINPAGSRDTLVDKLAASMSDRGETCFGRLGAAGNQQGKDVSVNNYTRPEGQNVGNFVTDRCSSRVLAPPGGKSSVHFFGATAPSATVEDTTRRSMSPPAAPKPPPVEEKLQVAEKPEQRPAAQEGLSLAKNDYPPDPPPVGGRRTSNNYTRPGERQNVGNYITGRNTSRVLAPPGGGSSISFG